MKDTYHAGERAVQALFGEREEAEATGRIIRNCIPSGAITFVSHQKIGVMSWKSPEGSCWAIVISGAPGFAMSDPSGKTLLIEKASVMPHPISAWLRLGDHLGFLFVELGTRRRLRVNGRFIEDSGPHLKLRVDEAYPNCPKYIQKRNPVVSMANPPPR
jgi:hypothetical protein